MAVAFSNNGKQLASLSRDQLKIWDYITGQCLKTTSTDTNDSRTASLTYLGNRILFAVKSYRYITIYHAETGFLFKTLDTVNGFESICFSKDGATLAACLLDGTVKLWDVATGVCKVTFTVSEEISRLRFSESGSQLITPTGIINLESLSSTGAETSTPQTLEITQSNYQGLMLSGEYQSSWIQKNSKPILWIPPPEYRPRSIGEVRGWLFDVRGSAVALCCPSGRVLMMEFSSDLSVM